MGVWGAETPPRCRDAQREDRTACNPWLSSEDGLRGVQKAKERPIRARRLRPAHAAHGVLPHDA